VCVRQLLQVKDATLKRVKALEEAKEGVETERDSLKVSLLGSLRIGTDACLLSRALRGSAARSAAAPHPPLPARAWHVSRACTCARATHAWRQAAVASLEQDVEGERHAAAAERKKLAALALERDVLNKLRTQVCGRECVRGWCEQRPSVCARARARHGLGFARRAFGREPPRAVVRAGVCVRLPLPLQADSATQKQVDLMRMTENTKRTLEQEVAAYRWVRGAGLPPHAWPQRALDHTLARARVASRRAGLRARRRASSCCTWRRSATSTAQTRARPTHATCRHGVCRALGAKQQHLRCARTHAQAP
jgi:hypothetical protein